MFKQIPGLLLTETVACECSEESWDEKKLLVSFLWLCLHHSRRLLMEAQILRAGPSLIFMVDMRWSSRRSSRACPSISCERNCAASSSQPEHNKKTQRHDQHRGQQGMTVLLNDIKRSTNNIHLMWPPTLKWRDKPEHFFHTPLSRGRRKKVCPIQREATGGRAVRLRSAVVRSRAGVRRAWGQRGRIVVIFFLFSVAGRILRATGLRVTLQQNSRDSNTKATHKASELCCWWNWLKFLRSHLDR